MDLSFTGPAGEVVAGSSENRCRACQLILYHSRIVSGHLISTALSYFQSGRVCYYLSGFVALQDSNLNQVVLSEIFVCGLIISWFPGLEKGNTDIYYQLKSYQSLRGWYFGIVSGWRPKWQNQL